MTSLNSWRIKKYSRVWRQTSLATTYSCSYAVDEHYYVEPKWLYENVDFYDNYPRNIGIFAGEYAGHDENQKNSVEAALAEAAMLTGMEKNGDIVKLASYAPLFNRIGHSQWTPDMIWFDADNVVLTPSYYVQKIFSDYAGSEYLELNGQEYELRKENIYVSAVKNDDKIIIKIVNANESEKEMNLESSDFDFEGKNAEVALLQPKDGKYIKPVANGFVDPNGPNKAISAEKISNFELCQKRFPEEVDFTIENKTLSNKILVPAKSVLVLKF